MHFVIFVDDFLIGLQNGSQMKEIQKQLNDKLSEIRRLQSELTRRDNEEEGNETTESLKSAIATLEQENTDLKVHVLIFCFTCCGYHVAYGHSYFCLQPILLSLALLES